LKGKDLLSISDLSTETLQVILDDASEFKAGRPTRLPEGKILALLFEKPSLRTRVSFEAAMAGLGGRSLYLSPAEVGLGQRESVADVARVISRYVDIVAARTFSHKNLEELAAEASIPVINALSDAEHPCQALADLLTIREKTGRLKGIRVAYIGDGNNVANSLVLASAMMGMDIVLASPDGYGLREDILAKALDYGSESGARVECINDPRQAVSGANVVYTDVWTSMGQEAERKLRQDVFTTYQVNSELLWDAPENVLVMHPLPAHRGEEITADVLDGPHSVVFDQAENRMHIARVLLLHFLGGLEISVSG